LSVFGSTFGAVYGAVFGSVGDVVFTPPVASTVIVNPIAEAAIDRLLLQFRDRPQVLALLRTLTGPMLPLRDAILQLRTIRDIDASIGVTLDKIGKIVGQTRNGNDDATYRPFIRTKIARNRSKGLVEDLIRVTRLALTDVTTLRVEIDQIGPAGVVVRTLLSPLPSGRRTILIGFLRQTVKAGVRVILESLNATPEDTFTFAKTAFALSPETIGDNVLGAFTSGFPVSGTLVINFGLADQETVIYSSRTSTTFRLVGTLTKNHPNNSCIQLADQPGKGWGTTTDPTHGGAFASAS
jgi:hypothetical protein